MTIIILAIISIVSGFYLVLISNLLKTKSVLSYVCFKFIPMTLGIASLFCGIKIISSVIGG